MRMHNTYKVQQNYECSQYWNPPNQAQPIQTESLEHLYHLPLPNTGTQAPELGDRRICIGIEESNSPSWKLQKTLLNFQLHELHPNNQYSQTLHSFESN